MATELLEKYGTDIKSLTLLPSGGGVYEVTLDKKLVFSKKKLDRFPELMEIIEILDAN